MPDTTSCASFWNKRYRSGNTPWDYGTVPPEFSEFLQRHSQIRRLLVPGCGRGYELLAASDLGLEVTGIDLSEEAARSAQQRLPSNHGQVVTGNFFTHPFPKQQFDAVYERTFLCAIAPKLRPLYVSRITQLLKPRGFLFGYFLFGEEPDPPPYPLQPGADSELFAQNFRPIESKPSRAPLPFFEYAEQWQVWQKR